jgi:hypothetical protein
MKIKIVRSFKSCSSLFLSFILVASLIGCSPNNALPNISDTDIQSSQVSEEVISDTDTEGKITDNGLPISDLSE